MWDGGIQECGNDSYCGLSVLWGECVAAYDGETSLQMCSVFWQKSFCYLLFTVTSEAGWAGIVFMVRVM